MHPQSKRLFALDEAIRTEGKQVLADSGIGAILSEAGYVPVGSQVTRTMTWRDLDFERYVDEPDWEENWEIGTKLARTGWCVRLNCVNVYREQAADNGFYWGVIVAHPDRTEPASKGHPTVWKLDLWTGREREFNLEPRKRWEKLMTEEARANILAIKEAVCLEPEYRKTMISAHIYEAVLDHGITDLESFREWWEEKAAHL